MGKHVFVRIEALGYSQQCFSHARTFSSVKHLLSNKDEVSCSHNTEVSYTLDTLLLDFSLTVKAATLIFISGCGLAISSA